MITTPKATLVPVVAALLALAVLAVGCGRSSTTAPAGSSATAHGPDAPGAIRTVLVARDRMPAPSRAGAPLHALRVAGPVPGRGVIGTVLSDEDCAPDARGVSHCLNAIGLPGDRVLQVRHPHRMVDVPCLSPGERVNVRAA